MKHTAVFSDGMVVIRNSKNHYKYAWRTVWVRAWDGKRITNTGFTKSYDEACKESVKCHSYVDFKIWHNETDDQHLKRITREIDEKKRSIESQIIEIVSL